MKAAQVNKYGGTDVIEINNDAPMPELKASRILVEIHAASINPFDSKMRNGLYIDSIPMQLPYIPGRDSAGF